MKVTTNLRRWLCARPYTRCIQINSVQGLISPLNKEGFQERILGDRFQETGFGAKVSCMKDRALGTLYEVPIRERCQNPPP